MAPEQASGFSEEVGPLADVYGLGAILYECLTGQPPFKARTVADTILLVQGTDPAPPSRLHPKVHRDLETICLKCLAKRPARRYDSALSLAADLHRYLDGEPILGRRESLVSWAWRRLRRHLVTSLLLVAVLAASILAVVFSRHARHERARTQLAEAIEQQLGTCDGSDDSVQGVEELIEALWERGDSDRAVQVRKQLHQRCGSLVRDGLRAPRLTPVELLRFEGILAVLERRDPGEALALRQSLARRLRDWESILDLQPPFSGRNEAFEVGFTEPDDQAAGLRPGKSKGPVLLSRLPSAGNVQLEAWLLREEWRKAPAVGLVLNGMAPPKDGTRPGGYSFLLTSGARTLGDAVKDRAALLQVYRNGVRLREARVQLDDGPLHLLARREGDRLLFQINDRPALEVLDIFPLRTAAPGVFGIHLPAAVHLQRLRAQRQSQPVQPSPLEQGDELYARGQFRESLEQYQAQAQARSVSGDDQYEARYKEALCLVRLQREPEAVKVWQQVAGDSEGSSERWRLAALCQLWLLEVRRGRDDEADAVLRSLGSHSRFAELASHVPDEVREEMIEAYHPRGTFDLLRHNPHRTRNLERALEVQSLLQAPADQLVRTRGALLAVYLAEDRPDRAAALAEELLRQPTLAAALRVDVMQVHVWMLLRKGQPERGLDEINKYLLDEPAGSVVRYREAYLPLLLSRARIFAQQKRWREAQRDLDDLFRLAKKPLTSSTYLFDAWLLLGFLREQLGDEKRAREAWVEGLKLARQLRALHAIPSAIMGSLTGDLTRQDAEMMVAGVLGDISGKSPLMWFIKARLFPVEEVQRALRATWQGPRGREWARRIAFRDVSHEEMLSVQAILGFFEGCRLGAFPNGLTDEEDVILWQMFNDIYRALTKGEVTERQIITILAAWGGATGPFGWGGLEPKLSRQLKAPLAYVLGRRSVQIKKPADADMYFRTVVKELPGSPLARLAEAEMKKRQAQ